MSKPRLSVITAEKQFAAIQKKHEKTLSEMDIAQQEKAENIARQRGLRLAKEVVDKKAEEASTAEKTAKKEKKPLRLPKVHRSGTLR